MRKLKHREIKQFSLGLMWLKPGGADYSLSRYLMSKDFTQLKSGFWDSGFSDGHRIAEAGASGASLHRAVVRGRIPLCPAHPAHARERLTPV